MRERVPVPFVVEAIWALSRSIEIGAFPFVVSLLRMVEQGSNILDI